MRMDIQARICSLGPRWLYCLASHKTISLGPCSSSGFWIYCARRESDDSQRNGGKNGDKFSTDWDKAWSNFKKQGKKSLFSDFSPDKYVSWNPRRSDFPLSEEVDPIKRTERSYLGQWTSTKFTLAGAIVIVVFLLLYTIQAPVK